MIGAAVLFAVATTLAAAGPLGIIVAVLVLVGSHFAQVEVRYRIERRAERAGVVSSR